MSFGKSNKVDKMKAKSMIKSEIQQVAAASVAAAPAAVAAASAAVASAVAAAAGCC